MILYDTEGTLDTYRQPKRWHTSTAVNRQTQRNSNQVKRKRTGRVGADFAGFAGISVKAVLAGRFLAGSHFCTRFLAKTFQIVFAKTLARLSVRHSILVNYPKLAP